jgi:hypothetical protein
VNRLRKFVERGPYGESPGRTAYVFDTLALPEPFAGLEWLAVDGSSAAEEVLKHPGLKGVFKTAIERGCAVVTRE